jgi:lambda family phage tail tape measure protein
MSTATANINVSVNGLGQLDALDKKLSGIGVKFGGLKTKLAGIGFAAFGRSALTAADDLTDLSNATGIAVGRLVELQTVLREAGLTGDTISAGVTKFTQSIQEAADGSLKAQNDFAKLGITLEDLRTKSEEDLLSKALSGFDNIATKSEQATVKMNLFGKSFRTVDPTEFKSKLDAAAGTGDKYAESIRKAAELNDNLATAMTNLKIAFLQVTAPIVNVVNSLAGAGKGIETLVTILKVLGTVLLAVFGGGIAMAIVRFFGMFARGFAALGPAMSQVGKYFSSFGSTAAAGAEKAALSFAANGKLMTALRGVGAFLGTVVGGIAGVMGLGGNETKPQAEGPKKDTGQEKIDRGMIEGLAKKRQEIESVTKAFKDQNNQTLQSIALEEKYIGVSADTAEILKAQDEIYKRQQTEIEKLRDAKKALGNDEKGLGSVYDAQIIKISVQAQKDAERVAAAMSGLQGVRLLEQDRLNNIERINQALQKQISYDQSLLQIRQQTQSQLGDAEFEGAQMKRSPLERQFAGIQENARKAALEASRAFSEQFSAEDMGAEDAKKLADGLALIAQRYQAIANVQSANLSQSRTWEEGWKSAFDSYIENSTNAAKVAGDAFSSFTSNMNSAIDNFVNTGKFSFGDFARSVIQDLIKIELKAQASKILSGVLSGAGSFFSSLLGFAEGGQPPINKPSIVGEKGPELFVPKTAGTIVPNGGSGGGTSGAGGNTYITNNISAVDAKSVAQLFAENRRTLFGTVEMARKELSYGR